MIWKWLTWKNLPWRTAFYLLLMLYLALDLAYCHGPLHRKIASLKSSSKISRKKALQLGWVAIVNQEAITRARLNLEASRFLYQRGLKQEDLSPSRLVEIRRAALVGLIEDTMIRQYADGTKHEAPAEEIKDFIASWESQFPTPEDLESRTARQGLTAEERREELARIWRRKHWLAERVAPGTGVTDEQVKAWFEAKKAENNSPGRDSRVPRLVEPEKIRARHIFVSTVEEDSPAREALIREARKRIVEGGEDFAEVAKTVSEDERTKERGGELNWFSRERLPEDFAAAVFAMQPGPVGEPFRTSMGWHLVEVQEREPERELRFEEVAGEIRQFLLNEQRNGAIEVLISKLRKDAKIMVFPENI